MTGKTTGYISIMFVALILGLMLAVQFRVANVPASVTTDRAKEIVDELNKIDQERQSLLREINDLNYKLEQVNRGKNEAIEALTSELNKNRMMAGLVTVTGPGVEVVLDNPDDGNGGRLPPGEFIFAEDLLMVVNELWGAGAEAISINGERIVATTEIRFANPFININTKRVVPPYQVLAIGDPDVLAETLELPNGLVDYLREMGIQVTVEKHQQLTVPAYTGS